MTPEAMEKVKSVFEATLYERYAGELVFDPVIVKRDVDFYGDDYVRVLLVVNGNTNLLDPEWNVGLITRVRNQLDSIGIQEFPSPYFIDSQEYQSYLRRGEVDSL